MPAFSFHATAEQQYNTQVRSKCNVSDQSSREVARIPPSEIFLYNFNGRPRLFVWSFCAFVITSVGVGEATFQMTFHFVLSNFQLKGVGVLLYYILDSACGRGLVNDGQKKMSKYGVQGFRLREGLSCVTEPVWPAQAGCYSWAAMSSNDSKTL